MNHTITMIKHCDTIGIGHDPYYALGFIALLQYEF
jgi:hypothetical protein